MKYVSIKGKTFSKVVCGTNAIYGRSHFSKARDKEYLNRCTDEYIGELLRKCSEFGVNAVETSANERIQGILSGLNSVLCSPLQMIGSTRIDSTSQMKNHREKLDFLLEHKAEICVVHSQFVDRPRKNGEINGLKALIDKIHNAGLIAGISTHRNSTVELCEAKGYEIDTYVFPLNLCGYVYPGYDGVESVEDRVNLIQSVQKPFILMKTLGAGRISPVEGLKFVLKNSKSNDIITLGLGSLEEAEESLKIVNENLF